MTTPAMHAGVAGSGIAGSQRDWYPLIYRENRNSSFLYVRIGAI